jgi:acyl carrier protein
MTKEKFIEVIEEQFDEIESNTFTMDTDFRDNEEWDSLIALSIIAALDSEFNVSISSEELEKAITIEDLYKLTYTQK